MPPTVRIPISRSRRASDRPDSPEPLDRQSVEKSQFVLYGYLQQPIRLAFAACDLGQQFRAGDPHADSKSHFLEDLPAETGRDVYW